MNKRKKLNLIKVGFSFVLALLVFQAPAMADAPKFWVLADEPMANTYIAAYPQIEDLFESDKKIVLIAEVIEMPKEQYTVNVQIQDSKGDDIYDEQKNLEKKMGKDKPYIVFTVDLDDQLKQKLSPGIISINVHVDNMKYPLKTLSYGMEGAPYHKAGKVYILPFYSSKNQLFDYRARNNILNTFSDAIKGAVQRINPEVIPVEMSAYALSKLKQKGCFEDEKCKADLVRLFGEGVFITGDVIIIPGKKGGGFAGGVDQAGSLEIFCYDSKKNVTLKFQSTCVIKPDENPVDIMQILLNQIFDQKMFLLSIGSML